MIVSSVYRMISFTVYAKNVDNWKYTPAPHFFLLALQREEKEGRPIYVFQFSQEKSPLYVPKIRQKKGYLLLHGELNNICYHKMAM
jgi:hypothetical protein